MVRLVLRILYTCEGRNITRKWTKHSLSRDVHHRPWTQYRLNAIEYRIDRIEKTAKSETPLWSELRKSSQDLFGLNKIATHPPEIGLMRKKVTKIIGSALGRLTQSSLDLFQLDSDFNNNYLMQNDLIDHKSTSFTRFFDVQLHKHIEFSVLLYKLKFQLNYCCTTLKSEVT